VLEDKLKLLGARGELIRMAKNGQLLELRCEMPTCYREHEVPNGRERFDPWPKPKQDGRNSGHRTRTIIRC
jgi:hypothetical protein